MAGAATDTALLTEAVVYLASAAVLVPLFTRYRLGAVLGYLAAGILIGPNVMGLITEPERALAFAELGVVLLLFVVGLELRPARLWAMRHDIFGLGTLQVLLCGLALTGALLALTAFTWQAALVIGLALALSSTALDVQLLKDSGTLNTPLGNRVISVHLMQDLAIVPLLILTNALARVPDPTAPQGLELAWKTAAAVVGLVVAGRYLLNPLFRVIASSGAREVFVIGALLTVLGSALLMASLGLSMALGAFVAGVMLADSPWRHEVEADIEPFRGLLLGLFFIAVGMTLDLGAVMASPWRILLLVLVLLGVKWLIIAALARAFGTRWPDNGLIGVHLMQGGEFAFVVLAAATAGLLIAPAAASVFTAVVILSMALTPPALALWHRFFDQHHARAEPDGLETPEMAPQGTAIVIGYGRFGQIVSQMLHARGVEVVLIDRKPEQIERSRQFGWRVYYGDGFRPDVLRAAGAEQAQLLIVTSGGGSWDPDRLDPIRVAFPHLQIIVRAHDRQHYMAFLAADLPLAVRELFRSAVEVGQLALAKLGTSEKTIEAITTEFIRRDGERLSMQVASGDIMAGRDTVFRPGHGWQPEAAALPAPAGDADVAAPGPGNGGDFPGDPARDPAAAPAARSPAADG